MEKPFPLDWHNFTTEKSNKFDPRRKTSMKKKNNVGTLASIGT